ncbi:DUF6993 domain-containing protein [Cryobacterium tepidiphilum]|uniref:DUF6993 domain-containing protein n=1 Tax=Cryobacterium tepidiphilum TaxID=2486026 RepID=A0A3M8L349_9MICO|nr:hypothetical protein [Cryobacterium tepidiphilum]RNE59128.1 hypothetical protein EEJ31_10885 [Cryobacterium tepidiphilum]
MRNHGGTATGRRRAWGPAALTIVALASVGCLAGCTAAEGGAHDPGSPAPSSPVATPTPTPIPSLDPSLSAEQNLAFFDMTVKAVLAKDPSASGAALVDALVVAGFDRGDMEVTPDRTTADLEADSIQFSVRFNGECIVGQRGPEDKGYHSMVAPLLGTGRCLLGSSAK